MMLTGQASMSLPASPALQPAAPSKGQLCRDGCCGQGTAGARFLTALWSPGALQWWLEEPCCTTPVPRLACAMNAQALQWWSVSLRQRSETMSAAGDVQ